MARALAFFGVILAALFLNGGHPALAADRVFMVASGYSPGSGTKSFNQNDLVGNADQRDKAELRQVTGAIWEASQRTGVQYEYLLAQAQIESGLDPKAQARTSSASGLFQFIEGTWLRSLDRHAERLGLSDELASSAKVQTIRKTLASRPRHSLLQLRKDPHIAALMAAAYAQENDETLRRILGRSANPTELYLAHFLGSGGASRFLIAWQKSPHRSAAALFPRAARANRPIFFAGNGRARSLDAVRRHIAAKMQNAFAATEALQMVSDPPSEQRFFVVPVSRIAAFAPLDDVSMKLATGTLGGWRICTGSAGCQVTAEPEPALRLRNTSANPPIETEGNAHDHTCEHIVMCYSADMSTSTITRVRDLIESGEMTKAGLARAAGLHANTLRDAIESDWNPTAETLSKLEAFLEANDERPVLVGIEEIIDEARNGRMYILVDDEDRENEGDLIIPAQMATPAAVNFMATYGRGLICLALDKGRVDELALEPMSRNNKESMQTAFTISIEAKEGVTTGISAADRARTIAVAIDSTKGPDDIVTPGHVFPLSAREGGTLVRAGHTEAAVDISRLAGLNPSGVICEIMNEDGTMARLDDLVSFARKHDLKIGTIRDLIAYRMRNDHLVERLDERSFESDYGGQWRLITYRDTISNNEAYVLQKGHVSPEEPTLARVHPISVFDDVLGAPGPRKRTLQRAMGAIGDHGSGIIVILTQRVGSGNAWSQDEEIRNIGIGSQILADLGVHDMVLLSNSRPDLVALEGFGISITDFKPIPE